MNVETQQFLTLLGRAPARMTAEETSWVLRCQVYDISALIAARLLRPLGTPAKNAPKFFATTDVLKLAEDPSWLAKMTDALQDVWKGRNQRKKHRSGNSLG